MIGQPDDDLGNAYAILHDDGAGRLRRAPTHLAERPVRYKIPRTFEFTTSRCAMMRASSGACATNGMGGG